MNDIIYRYFHQEGKQRFLHLAKGEKIKEYEIVSPNGNPFHPIVWIKIAWDFIIKRYRHSFLRIAIIAKDHFTKINDPEKKKIIANGMSVKITEYNKNRKKNRISDDIFNIFQNYLIPQPLPLPQTTISNKRYTDHYKANIKSFWPYAKIEKSFDAQKKAGLAILMGDFHNAHSKEAIKKRVDIAIALSEALSSDDEKKLFMRGIWALMQVCMTLEQRNNHETLKESALLARSKKEIKQWLNVLSLFLPQYLKKTEQRYGERTIVHIASLNMKLSEEGKQLGKAIDNNDCYYGSVAYNTSRVTGKQHTVKSIHLALHNYLKKNNPQWAVEAIKKDKLSIANGNYDQYVECLQYTAEELASTTPYPFATTSVQAKEDLFSKILCEIYDINIVCRTSETIEIRNKDGIITKIDNFMTKTYTPEKGSSSKTVEIAFTGSHYMPIIPIEDQ